MNFHLTKVSSNRKTGRIPVTTSDPATCPVTCPWNSHTGCSTGAGCYAESGHLAMHWRKVGSGERGESLSDHIDRIRGLGPGLKRLNQAGDLPGDGNTLAGAVDSTRALLDAAGPQAWTYTHYLDSPSLDAIKGAPGCVVNLSTNCLSDLDKYASAGLPMVTMLASETKVQYSPKGIRAIRCPAEYQDIDCKSCGNGRPLCGRKDRDYAIGFYPHGTKKNSILRVIA